MARRRRLTAGELAEAAVLADVSVVLSLLGWFLPLGIVFYAAAVTPFAALAARRGLRAVLIGTWSGAAVSFLVGGPGLAGSVLAVAVFGFVVGVAFRHGWGRLRTVVFGVTVTWSIFTSVALGVLGAFGELRRLLFEQIEIGWRGTRRFLVEAGADDTVRTGDDVVAWTIEHWWAAIPIALLVLAVPSVLVGRRLAWPALLHLHHSMPATTSAPVPPEPGEPAPVPVVLEDVRFRHPAAAADALAGVSLRVAPAEVVAVIGPNGSGKTTLARVLAGAAPTSGTVTRPGPAGTGRIGGTAVIFQRPESQVLAARVRDDLAWGLPPGVAIPAEELLASVGLAGFADRETSGLSGGELQRLALAAALARRPRLLLSDESTAMLDPDGRQAIVALLRRVADEGIAVVHVTHRMSEARIADRVLVLDRGRVVAEGAPAEVLGEGVRP